MDFLDHPIDNMYISITDDVPFPPHNVVRDERTAVLLEQHIIANFTPKFKKAFYTSIMIFLVAQISNFFQLDTKITSSKTTGLSPQAPHSEFEGQIGTIQLCSIVLQIFTAMQAPISRYMKDGFRSSASLRSENFREKLGYQLGFNFAQLRSYHFVFQCVRMKPVTETRLSFWPFILRISI